MEGRSDCASRKNKFRLRSQAVPGTIDERTVQESGDPMIVAEQ